jgi:23S rRNA (adenine2503-C2)-methyltransferase
VQVTVSTVGLVDKLEQFASDPHAPQLALSLHATTDEVRGVAVQQDAAACVCCRPGRLVWLSRMHALLSHVDGDTNNAPQVRDWIVPVNRRHKLPQLTDLLRRHYGAGNAAGRRVLVEYTMLADVNDSLEDAARLLQLLEGIEAKVRGVHACAHGIGGRAPACHTAGTRSPTPRACCNVRACASAPQVNLITFNPFAGTRFRTSPIEQVLAFRSVLIRGGRVCTIRDSRGDDEMAACGQLGDPLASAKSAPILEPPERFRSALLAP